MAYAREIIANVISVLVAVISVYSAEYFAKKRDYKQKQIEIKIDYMRKEIEYLSQMEILLLDAERQVDNCLHTSNPKKKIEKRNLVINQLSELNEKNIAIGYMFDCYNKVANIEIEAKEFCRVIGNCCDQLQKICDDYLNKTIPVQLERQINGEVNIARNEIEQAMKLLTEKMVFYMDEFKKNR